MTIGELISTRLRGSGCTPARFRQELERHGVVLARQSIHAWLRGEARPTPANLLAVLEVLAIPAGEREAWFTALAHERIVADLTVTGDPDRVTA